MAEQLKSIGEEPRVDLVFHSAGILHEDGHMPETSLSKVDIDFMRRNLEVSCSHKRTTNNIKYIAIQNPKKRYFFSLFVNLSSEQNMSNQRRCQ